MSIEEFGASLLSDVRQRKDQQYSQHMRDQRKAQKRADKDARKQALIGVGLRAATGVLGELGNNFLKDKTEEFLNKSNHLDNALTMQNATGMQSRALVRQKELEDSGLDSTSFFAQQAMPQIDSIFAGSPEFSSNRYGKKELELAKGMAARHLGEKLKEAHETQLSAAQRLAAGDITYKAYMEEISQAAPTTYTKYMYGKLKGMFSEAGEDPITSGLRLNGVLDKAEAEKSYYNIYKESKDGFTATSILEVIQDNGLDLGKPNMTYGKSFNVPVNTVDMFGKPTTQQKAVKEVLLNGVSTGIHVDTITNKAVDGNISPVSSRDVDAEAAMLTDDEANIITTKITLNTTEEERKVFNYAAELITGGNEGGTNQEKQKRNMAARKVIAARVVKSRNKLIKTFGMPSQVAYQVAVKGHMLRYQSILKPSGALLPSFLGGGSYTTEEADFSNDIMPNKTHDGLVMYLGLELAEQEGLRLGVPANELLVIKKNLLNSVQASGFQTLSQRSSVLGVVDAEGVVVEAGLVDDPRFKDLNLREKLLNIPVAANLKIQTPSKDNGKVKPSAAAVAQYKEKYKTDAAFRKKYDTYYLPPEPSELEEEVSVPEPSEEILNLYKMAEEEEKKEQASLLTKPQ